MSNALGGIEDVGAGLYLADTSSPDVTIDTHSVDNMEVVDTSDYGGVWNIPSGYHASAISAIGTVGSSLINLAAKKADIKQKTGEIIRSMGATVKEYDFMASVNEQQMEAVDEVAGMQMSETGLTRLKNKASLRASAAMTGMSGGTTDMVIQEASIIEMMDNAAIVANAKFKKTELAHKIQGQYISAMNRLDNLAAGIQSPTSAAFSMVDAGLQGFTKAYSMLPESERRKFFGYTKDK